MTPPRPLAASFLLAAATLSGPPARAQAPPIAEAVDAALTAGDLAGAEARAADAFKVDPKDDAARFALGTVRFLRAVEARIQAFHRHGFHAGIFGAAGITNLPIPPNEHPEPIDGKLARALVQTWVDDLARVESTLAPIGDGSDLKLPIHLALIRLDFDGDGKRGDDEVLGKVYAQFNRPANLNPDTAKNFVVAFDRGDVDWLRGYCHLLSAPAEVLLAHDFAAWFDRAGFNFFAGARPPEPFLAARPGDDKDFAGQILDAVAAIHQLRLPVVEPARMRAAHAHLAAMVGLSRSTWKHYLAETDDDREWIPNPRQTAATGTKVTAEVVDGWHQFLDAFGAILDGKALVPFWRGKAEGRGINLRRVFEDPRPFDLILWVQGVSAAPYLEEGPVIPPETWTRINRVFRGEFIGFALWFN